MTVRTSRYFQVTTPYSGYRVIGTLKLASAATSVYNGMAAALSSGEWAVATATGTTKGLFYDTKQITELYDLIGLADENLLADASGNPMAGEYVGVVTGDFEVLCDVNCWVSGQDPTSATSAIGAGVWVGAGGLFTTTDPTGVVPIGEYLGSNTLAGDDTVYRVRFHIEPEAPAV